MSSESIFEIVMSAWLECSFRWALATLVAKEANGNVGLSSVKAYLFLLVAVLHRPNYVTLRLCCAVEQRALIRRSPALQSIVSFTRFMLHIKSHYDA